MHRQSRQLGSAGGAEAAHGMARRGTAAPTPPEHPSLQGDGRTCPPTPARAVGTRCLEHPALSQPQHLHQRNSPGHLVKGRARKSQPKELLRNEAAQGQIPPTGEGVMSGCQTRQRYTQGSLGPLGFSAEGNRTEKKSSFASSKTSVSAA